MKVSEDTRMSEPIPTVISSSTLQIMGVDLTVHVLDNGQRVIDVESFRRFLEALEDDLQSMTEGDALAVAKLVKGVSR